MCTSGSDAVSRLRDALPELRDRFGVRTPSVFGSVARGDATESSDVDVLVEFDRDVGIFHLIRLRRHLETLLGRRADVGTPGSLRPRARQRAMEEAVRVGC